MSEEEDFVVENPYTHDYSFNNLDNYIDYYEDEAGNKYDFDETVKITKGEYLLLKTVYSEDLSGAYRVSISYNPPEDIGFEDDVNTMFGV